MPRNNQLFPPVRNSNSRHKRRGVVIVLFALLLVVMIGLLGLVIDGGLLLAAHRQVYNAADAAVLAAAMDKLRGKSDADALATANKFIQIHNELPTAPDLVSGTTFNIPPLTGPYAGNASYVEVIVSAPNPTFFIQVLGISTSNVSARAVAGFEAVSAGEGVMLLDPDARPGLDLNGSAYLKVQGRIVVNSEAGGKDENGDTILCNSNNGVAASAGNSSSPPDGTPPGIYATIVDVVGGVDKPALFYPYDPGDPSPLRTCQLPEPDPLINLPTPTIALGVDPTLRGDVSISNTNVVGLDTDESGQNYLAENGEVIGLHTVSVPEGAQEVILHPGIYDAISVQGGYVYLIPGIYVIAAKKNNQNNLKFTGGSVIADGIMFYNTGNNYSPATGLPDSNDGQQKPPHTDGASLGSFQINDGMRFSPIDTTEYSYATLYTGAKAVSTDFDGMLFFQRRRNSQSITITGGSETGYLTGTLYAKWALFKISGQGTYDAQFIAGSMDISGTGRITLQGAGKGRGKANQVFLVE